MPINKPLLSALRKKYGTKKGTSVYFGMENKGSKSFKKGLATAKRQHKTAPHLKDINKRKRK